MRQGERERERRERKGRKERVFGYLLVGQLNT